jgi:thioredoxin 1
LNVTTNQPSAYLIIQSQPYTGRRAPISGSTYAIGRDPRCHLRPPDPGVDNVHATIHLHKGLYYIKDQRSQGGTFVNNRPVDLHQLQHGDILTLGNLQFQFHTHDPQPAAMGYPETSSGYSTAAPPVKPARTARPKKPVSPIARIYSLMIYGLILLGVIAAGGFIINALQPPGPPPGFDLANAAPATVMYFYADWCGYCTRQTPIMNRLPARYPDVLDVVFLDTDNPANASTVSRYGISGLPTTIILNDQGEIAEQLIGFADENRLTSAINRTISQ